VHRDTILRERTKIERVQGRTILDVPEIVRAQERTVMRASLEILRVQFRALACFPGNFASRGTNHFACPLKNVRAQGLSICRVSREIVRAQGRTIFRSHLEIVS
jgi:hypothetical protein